MRLYSIISATFLLHGCISAGDCISCLGAIEDAAANNNNAIRMASHNGDLKIVKKLLSRPDVDPAAYNNEAIRLASQNGHLNVVKELLSRPGVDPTADSNAAIRAASKYGHLGVVKELLSRPDVDPTANDNEAVRLASRNGKLKVVKELLLRPGVYPTANDNYAIRYASLYGQREVVKELLSWPGVDPTANNNQAIRWASQNSDLSVLKELLSRPGVDPTANNNEAIRSASSNGRLKIVKELLSRPGVDPTANNNEAIRYASRFGRLEVVQELLSSPKVDPSALESQSLKWAIEYDRIEVVKLLIKDGRVDPTVNNLALFEKAKQWSQNPALKIADRKTISEILLLLQHDEMGRSILFLQSQQHLTPTRFLEMINFEKAWIHDSYMKSVLKFPQVSELLSGILAIDLAAAGEITTLKRLNEEMVQLMKSLEKDMNYQGQHLKLPKSLDINGLERRRELKMDDQKPLSLVSRKRWDFLWRYFGALREYSGDKIVMKKKGNGVVEDVELGDNASDPFAKTAQDKEVQEDNASRFNYLTVWKLQNMDALPVLQSKMHRKVVNLFH